MSDAEALAEPGATERFLDALDAGRPAWHRRASCRGLGPERFFPPIRLGQSELWDEPRSICVGCAVREDCAEAGRSASDGMWGGLTPTDRATRRRARWRRAQP